MRAATRPIPLSSPFIDERDEELVLEVLRSGRLSLGPTIDRFEELFAEKVGAPYAAAVSSGTSGLHLLAVIAGLGEGDEVITSPYSFVASANCFIYEGAVPVFADVDERTMNLDPAAVEAAITEKTKAIVAVDIFGYPCELDPLRELCAKHGLTLIQDACEALGAEYKGKPVGSHGVDAVFAFYPNKQMTTGEGGIVTTHSEETRRQLVSLRNQGRADGGGWLDHARLGFNYRIDDVRAALGIGQLEKLDTILASAPGRCGSLWRAARGRRRGRGPARRRRRPRALLVRLRRHARAGHRPRAGDRRARASGDRDLAVPALDPPAGIHARALRLQRGPLPGFGGPVAAHARAAVLHRDRRGGPGTRRRGVDGRAGLAEALAVWGLLGLEAAATLVTYSRLPPEALYNVDDAGNLAAGLGRTLVLLNYPLALVAIGLAATAGGPRLLVGLSIALSSVTAVPGVVDQDDLDARWINALPALGVLLALGLTMAAVRRDGIAFVRRAHGDRVRLVLAVLLLLLALPWFAAEAGFYFPGDVFMGEEFPPVRDEGLAAVHLGFHHGSGGVVLALAALLLSRVPAGGALRAYLSLMLAYGLANALQDAWNEQLWKREWVDWHAPSVLRPDLTLGWLAILLGAAGIYALWFRPPRQR